MQELIIFWGGVLLSVTIYHYNAIIKKKNQVENAFGSIDVMLQKRYDLLPRLATIVKGYAGHEKEFFYEITQLRVRFMSALSSDEKVELDKKIRGTVYQVNATIENYPELKAGENFLQLQIAWNEMEEQISAARRFFNAAVTDYNTKIEQFPALIIARIIGYKRKLVFEVPDNQRKKPEEKEIF